MVSGHSSEEKVRGKTHFMIVLSILFTFSASSVCVQSFQKVTIESAAPETIVFSSSLTASAQILSSWLSSDVAHSSSLMFQILTRPSDDDETSCWPCVRKSTRRTEFEWPSKVWQVVKEQQSLSANRRNRSDTPGGDAPSSTKSLPSSRPERSCLHFRSRGPCLSC